MSIEEARHRVHAAIDILSTYVPAELVRGAKVLDIGCGTGNGVIAALTLGARCAIGIDRDAHEFGETFFQPLAREFGVDQSSALLIEADIFKLKSSTRDSIWRSCMTRSSTYPIQKLSLTSGRPL